MMTTTQASAVSAPKESTFRSHPVLALVLVAAAVAMIVQQQAFREFEATLMAPLLQLVLEGNTVPVGTAITIGIGTEDVTRLVITSLCSTLVLFAPLLIIAGLILLMPKFSVGRIASGLALSIAISALANLGRYAMAAFAMQQGGMVAFDIVHRWIGSLMVIFAFAFALFVLVRIATNGRLRSRRVPVPQASAA
ncbi:exosortase S [Humidisolicoccus flavus]|uniref:exosortase S n=1 Tax=Humidisolicoccus flavus TaxID=3111414 RepID=UPI0032465C54